METDAMADTIITVRTRSRPASFKITLQNVSEGLLIKDLRGLRFLCAGDVCNLIPMGKMEKIRSSLHLFEELESMSLIFPPNEFSFLCELLHHVGRNDLLGCLQHTVSMVKASISESGSRVNSYRLMLYKLCEDVTKDILEELSFLCSDELTSTERELIKTSEDFITILEKKQLISSSDLFFLVEILTAIRKPRLVCKINEFRLLPQKSNHQQYSTDQYTINPDVKFPHLMKKSQPIDHQGSVNNVSSFRSASVTPATDVGSAPSSPLPAAPPPLGHGVHGAVANPSASQVLYPTGRGINDNAGSADLTVDSEVDLPSYSMTHRPRGLCIIISNSVFNTDSGANLTDRTCTKVDEDNLKQLFENRLDFCTEVFSNLSDIDMISKLKECAKRDHGRYDCFVCCVLSHGTLGTIYGVNGRTVKIRKLMEIFTKSCCPSLGNKPKLFFLQSGEEHIKEPVQGGGDDIEMDGERDDDPRETIPSERDFLLCYSTVPGCVSYRSSTVGSWYINSLVRTIDRYRDNHDLMSMMIAVNQDVSLQKAVINGGHFYQSPAPMATLRRRIFFH